MDKNFVDFGYIDKNNQWHHKRYYDDAKAAHDKHILEIKHIPFMEYNGFSGTFDVSGMSFDTMIRCFIEMGGEWDIDDGENDRSDAIPYMVFKTITNIDNIEDDGTCFLFGHRYTIDDYSFSQDEQWADAYNSYSGYDKVRCITMTDADDDNISICFYHAL